MKVTSLIILLFLNGCNDREIKRDAAQCEMQARNRFPRMDSEDTDLYAIIGPAAELAESCMKMHGYAYGGPEAKKACFEKPDISSHFKPECYH